MGRIKSQLRFGQWPDSPTPAHHPAGLTVAARRLAEVALEELGRSGVAVELDKTGRARFRPAYSPSRVARLAIERHGDLIEAYLRERRDIADDGLETLTKDETDVRFKTKSSRQSKIPSGGPR